MSKKVVAKKPNLLILMLPLVLGMGVLSFIFRQNTSFQFLIILLALVSYIIFSLMHHYFDKTLTFEVVIEYILIAGLVLIILTSAAF